MRARVQDMGQKDDTGLDRRSLLKAGLALGGLLGAGGLAGCASGSAGDSGPRPTTTAAALSAERAAHPNILVILVDQMRYPQWYSPATLGLALPPNVQRLSEGAVSFARHYTASNDCTPARATLLTGLYTHQTGCLITGGSTLDPGFPTYGSMLRELGYDTRWYGKWHLTHHDNFWSALTGPPALDAYGFAGGTFPSPDGAPGQGHKRDPVIATEFEEWLTQNRGAGPWCATVSFVNPHDIAWWYLWTNKVPSERDAPPQVTSLPPNFETPEELIARDKPRLQRSLQQTAAASFGPVPFHGPLAQTRWLDFANLYVKLQAAVDVQVGRVLAALERDPQTAANTVVIFSSDHGEYGGSHGLRGKGAAAYEEAIRVPLIVRDPRGRLTAAPEVPRRQLTSSVDIAPLLLTIASGSSDWRGEPRHAQIAGRLDLTQILGNPSAPGRPYVLHATDEIVTEFAAQPYSADAPLHIIAMRTQSAKYALYSDWRHTTIDPVAVGQEEELYDYSNHEGRMEMENLAGQGAELEQEMVAELHRAVAEELRAPLPAALVPAQQRGFADYFGVAKRAARSAAAMRRRRVEGVTGPLREGDTGGKRP